MSDCSRRAWNHKWSDQEWHAPSGRTIHAPESDELHEVTLLLEDDTERHYFYAGPRVRSASVDGERFVKPPFRDYDVQEVD